MFPVPGALFHWNVQCRFSLQYLLLFNYLSEMNTKLRLQHKKKSHGRPTIYTPKTKKTKLCGLSPWANYTDRATAACRGVCANFANRAYHVVSLTDPYGRILNFLDRSRYIFFQVAPQLYSRGWVHPVPDPLLLRKSGSAGNRTRTSASVARNSDD
jgi:hypothetical protein